MKTFRKVAAILTLGLTPALGTGSSPASNTLEPVGYVLEDLQGTQIEVREAGASGWNKAHEGQVLEAGDEVRTGKGSRAALSLDGETNLHLGEGSSLEVQEASLNGQGGFMSRLKLAAGRLLADVKKNLGSSRSTFEVETNGVVCGVRGTLFELTAGKDLLDLCVHEGGVEVAGDGAPRLVRGGHSAGYKLGRFLLLRKLDRNENDRLHEWRKLRRAVLAKRLQRLEEIRKDIRKPWRRKHPRLKKAILRKAIQQNRRP